MEFVGIGGGAPGSCVGEIVFNTSVVGYQEIVSDPSYAGQILVMTYPLIGNYGMADEDFESHELHIAGLVVRECCDTPSNFRSTQTLEEVLEERGVPCLSGIDTRMLTKIIRREGRPMAAIVDDTVTKEEALAMIKAAPRGENLVKKVSSRKRWLSRTPGHTYDVVVVDCGIKTSIVKMLNSRGCNLTILPYNATEETVLSYNPDGVLVSNGPGSVEDVPEVRDLLDKLIGKVPVFGIGLGMELIGVHYGAQLESMGCGMHGDHPVKDLATSRIGTAVMNQSNCFKSLDGTFLEPTFVSVPEGYVEGFINRGDRVSGVQFHLEAAPGPEDFNGIIDSFIKMMEEKRNA